MVKKKKHLSYVIDPFVGPLPLRFGMTREEVGLLIGKPKYVHQTPINSTNEGRDGINVGFSAETSELDEVVFFDPAIEVSFLEQNLWDCENLIEFLSGSDPEPQLWVGFVVFPQLGISLTGVHNEDESRTIHIQRSKAFQVSVDTPDQ